MLSNLRLLFDQNLSRHLNRLLEDLYPDSLHVRDINLESGHDNLVWEHAKSKALVIVTKDSDFVQLSAMLGHPPKVIWLRLGNVSTRDVETLLRHRYEDISVFCQDGDTSLLTLP